MKVRQASVVREQATEERPATRVELSLGRVLGLRLCLRPR
jgi:hypothetical protein